MLPTTSGPLYCMTHVILHDDMKGSVHVYTESKYPSYLLCHPGVITAYGKGLYPFTSLGF